MPLTIEKADNRLGDILENPWQGFADSPLSGFASVETLNERERAFSTLMSNLPGMAYRCRNDRQWTMEFLSEGCLHLTGYKAADLIDNRRLAYGSLIHPDDRKAVWEHIQAALTRRERFQVVYRVLTAQKVQKWVWEQGLGIYSTEGELQALEGFVTDITERKCAEERFRSVWERSADGMRLTDREGRVIAVNDALCRLIRLPRESLEGQCFSVMYKAHGPNDGIEVYHQRFRSGQIVPRLSTRVQFWDGRAVELEISNSFIDLPDQGKVLLSIFRDVSERKQLEQQLRQAQKMDAIGQLAGGVAHDFNNLLLVMRGNAELLLMDDTSHSPETLECLKQITSAAERAANLTRQLLAFSRKQVLQPQPLVLEEVISNLAKMLKRIIGEHIQMKCVLEAKTQLVQADPGMMEQVLINLAVNARDAMKDGGDLTVKTHTVTVSQEMPRAHPDSRAGEFLCLTVSDTGTGIAPDYLGRIFEPFFTTKAAGQGTGLGLAMVYGIVKQHEGWIEVESRLGHGSQFRVFLPLISEPASQQEKIEAVVLLGGTETLLLVEDDEAVRMVTKRLLEGVGYKVYAATDGREALEIWRQHAKEISLLLTDMVLPEGKNGSELASELRQAKPGLHAVFMSGYHVGSAQVSACQATTGSTRFLQKPCPSSQLLEALRQCLDSSLGVAA